MLPKLKKQNEGNGTSGQALLIILLTMTVALTVVLSIVSRSVTDISVTTYEEDSQRAFDAAEAGIEQALLSGSDQPETSLGNAKFTTDISSPLPASDEAAYPSDVLAGESATFWFMAHDSSGNFDCSTGDCLRSNKINQICWGKPGAAINNFTPAIEISLFYDTSLSADDTPNDFSNVKIARFAYDPYSARAASNNFRTTSATCSGGISSKNFAFSTGQIQLNNSSPPDFDLGCPNSQGCLIMAKVKLLYNYDASSGDNFPHPVGININPTGGTHLPAQGTQIDSVGEAGDTIRRVNVFQGYPEPPFVFEAAIFGAGGLSK